MNLLISPLPSNETGNLKMSLICHSRFIKLMVSEAGKSDICMVPDKGLSTVSPHGRGCHMERWMEQASPFCETTNTVLRPDFHNLT